MIDNQSLNHLKITPGNLELFLSYVKYCINHKKKSYCIPLNLTKYETAKKDQKLKNVILEANFIIADGIPISWLSRRLGVKGVSRITGIELAEAILMQSNKKKWKIFLLGAKPDNIKKAQAFLRKKFNDPIIVGAVDGYFNNKKLAEIIIQINKRKPDLLFLGLGMPQKEYFIQDYFDKINATFCLPVGGAFDVWAQSKKRSPKLVQKVGLEWLQRSFYNRKKAKSIMYYGVSFLKDLIFLGR